MAARKTPAKPKASKAKPMATTPVQATAPSAVRIPKGDSTGGQFTTRPKQHRAMVARVLPFAPDPRSPGVGKGRAAPTGRGASTPGGALAR